MPIPFILGALGVGAGLLGVGGHMVAKDTNAEAEQILKSSKLKYDNAIEDLEKAKNKCSQKLENLGKSKKDILDTSMTDFIHVYERIKTVNMKESVGLEELGYFNIQSEDVVQLQQLNDVTAASMSSGAKGAAAGALISLAASGALPIIASDIGIAGSLVAMGEVGIAAEVLGSSLAFGAAMTPLAAIAAPLVLFSGFSASFKADENLDKAKQNKAEVDAAVEKMKVSMTTCKALGERADIFDELITELNKMFADSIQKLNKRLSKIKHKEIKAEDLNEEDIELIAMTRSLAGAIKAIIDTPIISKRGKPTKESEKLVKQTTSYAKEIGCVIPEKGNAKTKGKTNSKVDEMSYDDFNIHFEKGWNFIEKYGEKRSFFTFVPGDDFCTERNIDFNSKLSDVRKAYGETEKIMIDDYASEKMYVAGKNIGGSDYHQIEKAKYRLMYMYKQYTINFYFNGAHKIVLIGYNNWGEEW